MTESYSAFLRLRISRENLKKWLDAPVPPVSRWRDWRDICGKWYGSFEGKDLSEATEEELNQLIENTSGYVSGTNREALGVLENFEPMEDENGEDLWTIAAMNRDETEFVAGSLTYSESLDDFITFLTIARGAVDFLDANGSGLVLIHNYHWGDEDYQKTIAAIRLGPGDVSKFLKRDEFPDAVAAFQNIADAMSDEKEIPEFKPRHQFDIF